MHSNMLLRLTVSGLALTGAIGCAPLGIGAGGEKLSALPVLGVPDEAQLYAAAQAHVQAGRIVEALATTEQLVQMAPRDAGYRLLLGDLYLKNGRFASAEAAFADVLQLDPANTRASLSLALSQIANGKAMLAETELDRIAGSAQPGDLGLAYALAGRTERAIPLLENAARSPGADGRIRQNLALAYAIAGDWGKARVTAAQDVDSAELASRLAKWADLANPANANSRVARLMGVQPVEDPGQPLRLALATDTLDESQFAAVAEPAAPAETVLAPKPVEVAGYPAPLASPAPVRLAAAAASLVKAEPAVIKAPVKIATTPIPAFKPADKPKVQAPYKVGGGRYVVQIGAYQSAAIAQDAWGRAVRRYQLDGSMKPHSTVLTVPGKGTFHRLSIAGFQARPEAARLCRSIRAKGGACFVRTHAGDSLAGWAAGAARRG